MYKADSKIAEEFINHQEILDTMSYAETHKSNRALIESLIDKAARCKGLTHREAALLLECDQPDLIERIFRLAEEIKHKFYGNRIVMFAPLYLSNYCVNGCVYCPYHLKNKTIARKKLTQEEIRKEVIALQDMGHKRLALEAGEDPLHNPIEYILESIDTIYSIKHKNGAIRRVNVNIAATTVENYRRLKDAGIGTYILFQETYHKENYEALHPTGPKSKYAYHTEALDRALEAGIDDVGMGALIGLYNHKFEAMAMLYHTIHLEEKFGVGPHTISFPRIEPALNTAYADHPPYAPSDADFMKMIAAIRLAVPKTGRILTAREPVALRNEAIGYGISQIDAGSDIGVGAYAPEDGVASGKKSQFVLSDNRSLDQVIGELCDSGFLPSFCTGCYRLGRTGEHFMEFAVPGFVKRFCTPNAVLTLTEYLIDYASPETRAKGLAAVRRELDVLPEDNPLKRRLLEKLDKVNGGHRDLFF